MAHELAWKKKVNEQRHYARNQALTLTAKQLRSLLPFSPFSSSISRLYDAYPGDELRVRV